MKLYQLKSQTRNFYRVVMKDPSRKILPLMSLEFAGYLLTKPDTANQYFTKFLYRKDCDPHGNYVVPERILYKCWAMNDPVYIPIVEDKYLFERFLSYHRMPVAISLAYNCNTLFFRKNKMIQINSCEDFRAYLKTLLQDTGPSGSLIIKKRSGSSGGKSIFRVGEGDLDSGNTKIQHIFSEVLKSEYLFQEFILQHESINHLNPNCVNTIRIDSYTDRDGVSRVYSAFIRMGMNRAHVDNVSSGGAYVGIDMDKGTLKSRAHTDFSHGGAKNYFTNPQTGTRFEGYPIPYFKEATDLVCKAAALIPQLKILGWDVAILPDGPMIIEANDTPGITYSEVASGGFKGNLIFEEVLDEIKNEKRRRRMFRKSRTAT